MISLISLWARSIAESKASVAILPEAKFDSSLSEIGALPGAAMLFSIRNRARTGEVKIWLCLS